VDSWTLSDNLSTHDERRSEVAYTITCNCGYVIRGNTEDDVVQRAQDHIQDAHPDLVGKISAKDLLAMAEES
jgi:predicted small metal-binding protein